MRNHISTERVVLALRYLFIALAGLAIAGSIVYQQWETLLSAFWTLVLLLLPTLLARRARIFIPPIFQIVILLFIFASMYLGEVHRYFLRYWWWDIMLHSTSAVILGYIGFLLVYALNGNEKIDLHLSPFFIALFTFCFASALGFLWEIFEFAVDAIFGADMQKARNLEEIYGYHSTRLGVIDTMRDLIVNSCGALLVSVVGYLYLKTHPRPDSAFGRLKDVFIRGNPELFKSPAGEGY
jgi:hypothetical protein